MSFKKTLITGASSGIGENLAYEFAAKNKNLLLVARSESKLLSIKNSIEKKFNVTVTVLTLDLLEKGACNKLNNFVKKNKFEIEFLVNCAGFGSHGRFDKIDTQFELNMISLNCSVLTELTKLFLPHMLETNSGGILNVASIAGFLSGPYMAVYYATKAFVISLTESIATENKKSNTKFSALCPGPVATSFFKTAGIDILANPSRYKFVQSPKKIAHLAVKNFFKGKTIIAPFPYSFLVRITLFLPRKMRLFIIAKLNRLTDL